MAGGRRALLAVPGAATNEHFDSGQQVFNVMHGTAAAQGDGLADDDLAINHWLERAAAVGGHRVLLPPGRYRVRRTLVLRGGVTLEGVGCNSVLVAADQFNGPLVTVAASSTDVRIRDLALDGNAAQQSSGVLVAVEAGARASLRDACVSNWKDAPFSVAAGAALDLGVITPEGFGAVGDGVTDDSAALARAAAAAHATGGVLALGASRYALCSTVDLSGLHGLRVQGMGAATVLVLCAANTTSGFKAAATNALWLRDFCIDGSGQAAVGPWTDKATVDGFGIWLDGGAGHHVQGIAGYRLNRQTVHVRNATDITLRDISSDGNGWQQADLLAPQVFADGIGIAHCQRVLIAGAHAANLKLKQTAAIRLAPLSTTGGGAAITDVTLRDITGEHIGIKRPVSNGGGALIVCCGYPSQGNLAERVVISGVRANDVTDSVIWFQGKHCTIADCIIKDTYTTGLELLGSDIHVSGCSFSDVRGKVIWIHTAAFDPGYGRGDQRGPLTTEDVTIENVQIEDASGEGGCGVFASGADMWAETPTPAWLQHVTVDDVRIKRCTQAGLQFDHVIGITHLGHVEVVNANQGTLETTTLTATPDGTSPVIAVANSAGFALGAYLKVGTPPVVQTGYYVGSLPDATHIALVDGSGNAVNAPNGAVATDWQAGKTVANAYAGLGAVVFRNDPTQAPVLASATDLVIRDTQAPVSTPLGVYVEGWQAPLALRVTTFGAFPASGGTGVAGRLQFLAGSSIDGVATGLPVPQSSGPISPPTGRLLYLPASGGLRSREPGGKDAYVPTVGPLATVLVDDFAGSSATSGQVGQWGWQFVGVTGTGGGGTVTRAAYANRPGAVVIDSGVTSGNIQVLYTGAWVYSTDDQTWEFLLAPFVVDANTLVRVGVAINAFNANPPATGWWLERGYGGSTWTLVSRDNGAALDSAPLAQSPVANTYQLLRLRKVTEGGVQRVYGSSVANAEVSIVAVNAGSAVMPATVTPFVQSGNNNGVSHTVRLDRVSVELPSLNRY